MNIQLAVQKGNHSYLKKLIEDGAYISTGENSPLFKAVMNGSLQCVDLLIKAGADVNALDSCGGTSLMLAARSGHIKSVTILLQAGAVVNIADKYNVTALMAAARGGYDACVRALIEAGADVNIPNPTGGCALVQAIHSNNIHCVQMIVKAGAYIPKGENSPLFKAAMSGFHECVDLLVKAGADVNALDSCGGTSLMLAARSGHFKSVNILLKAGAMVNIADKYNVTALMAAAQWGYDGCVKALLESGADVNISNPVGGCALVQAIYSNSFNCVHMIVKAGACVNNNDSHLRNAIDKHTAMYGISEMAMFLFVAGVKIDLDKVLTNTNSARIQTSLFVILGHQWPSPIVPLMPFTQSSNVSSGQLERYIPELIYEVPDNLKEIRHRMDLRHRCRLAVRKHLMSVGTLNLFYRIPLLPLPSVLQKFLLYYKPLTLDTRGCQASPQVAETDGTIQSKEDIEAAICDMSI